MSIIFLLVKEEKDLSGDHAERGEDEQESGHAVQNLRIIMKIIIIFMSPQPLIYKTHRFWITELQKN
jgi:hypothetical protein